MRQRELDPKHKRGIVITDYTGLILRNTHLHVPLRSVRHPDRALKHQLFQYGLKGKGGFFHQVFVRSLAIGPYVDHPNQSPMIGSAMEATTPRVCIFTTVYIPRNMDALGHETFLLWKMGSIR